MFLHLIIYCANINVFLYDRLPWKHTQIWWQYCCNRPQIKIWLYFSNQFFKTFFKYLRKFHILLQQKVQLKDVKGIKYFISQTRNLASNLGAVNVRIQNRFVDKNYLVMIYILGLKHFLKIVFLIITIPKYPCEIDSKLSLRKQISNNIPINCIK